MIVGVPKEIKPQENRVALTPAGAEPIPEAGAVFREAGRVRKVTEPPGDRTRLARLARGTPEPVRSAKGNREMPAQSPRISAT